MFSRDELKQDDMRLRLQNSKVKFYLGDVRDRSSVDDAMPDVDYVFHAAALKQVPSCEFHPMQAVKTNIKPNVFYQLSDTPKYTYSTWNKGDTCIAPYPIEILEDGRCRWKT